MRLIRTWFPTKRASENIFEHTLHSRGLIQVSFVCKRLLFKRLGRPAGLSADPLFRGSAIVLGRGVFFPDQARMADQLELELAA